MFRGFTQRRLDVYERIKSVMPEAREHVEIDQKRLVEFAGELCDKELRVPNWSLPYFPFFPVENDETFLRHLLIGNAINACYTEPGKEKFAVRWTPPEGEEELFEGSSGMWAALMRAREEGLDIYDGNVLRDLSTKDVEHIFRSDAGPLPLLEKRREHLADTGSYLARLDRQGLSLSGLIKDSANAGFLVHMLKDSMRAAYGADILNTRQMPAFFYAPSRHIIFDKRARLFALMYEGRARSSEGELSTLKNLEEIGPVIDYQIPKTLRHFGLLRYSEPLAYKVDNGIELVENSLEEFFLRAAAYVATEELYQFVRYMRSDRITMVELDYLLWSKGRKAEGEHHLTLTMNY